MEERIVSLFFFFVIFVTFVVHLSFSCLFLFF